LIFLLQANQKHQNMKQKPGRNSMLLKKQQQRINGPITRKKAIVNSCCCFLDEKTNNRARFLSLRAGRDGLLRRASPNPKT